MGVRHSLDAGANIRWKRCGLSRRHVDMNGHIFRSGGKPAFGGVAQFLKGMQPLFVGGDQQDRDLYGITEVNFPQIPTWHSAVKVEPWRSFM